MRYTGTENNAVNDKKIDFKKTAPSIKKIHSFSSGSTGKISG